jgi:hypothetical protein
LPPATTKEQREEYAAIYREHDEFVYQPVADRLNGALQRFGVGPLSMTLFDSVVELADAYLQLTVPSFEFPREVTPLSVRFVGTPPIIPNQVPLPSWADELDGTRKVVLVTQGTLANHKFRPAGRPNAGGLGQRARSACGRHRRWPSGRGHNRPNSG